MWLHKVKGLLQTENSSMPDSIEGTYRVMKVYWDRDKKPGEGRGLLLSDSSGELEVLLPGQRSGYWFEEQKPYELQLSIDGNHGSQIILADPKSIQKAIEYNPVSLIPKDWTPRPDGIVKLVALYQSLQSDSIKKFWQDVFTDDLWLRLFLSLPASKECHHSFPGGLFIHSLEVADNTQAALLRAENLTDLEKDTAMTIALLHDATKTVGSVGYPARWKIPFVSWQHERYLPYFLASALLQLKERDIDAWATMIRLLDDYTRPKEQLNSPLAEVIRHSDHLSAHLDARHSQREEDGAYRNWTKVCGRHHWGATHQTMTVRKMD